jgi:DNA-binding NtrC family response regulator
VKEFSPETLDLLHRYSYPGNVRELKNIVESSYYSVTGSVIRIADLPAEVRDRGFPPVNIAQTESHGRQLFKQIRGGAGDFEAIVKGPFLKHQFGSSIVREVIDAALREARGRYRDAFRLLKIPQRGYAVMMQFLKRHGCYLDYRPFRQDLEE